MLVNIFKNHPVLLVEHPKCCVVADIQEVFGSDTRFIHAFSVWAIQNPEVSLSEFVCDRGLASVVPVVPVQVPYRNLLQAQLSATIKNLVKGRRVFRGY